MLQRLAVTAEQRTVMRLGLRLFGLWYATSVVSLAVSCAKTVNSAVACATCFVNGFYSVVPCAGLVQNSDYCGEVPWLSVVAGFGTVGTGVSSHVTVTVESGANPVPVMVVVAIPLSGVSSSFGFTV